MRRLPVATFFLFFWSFHSFADQVVMSNGDRLSGLIIKSDAKALVIKTEFAGEVTVQWGAISEINSTDPLHVTVRDGKPLVGKIKSSQNNVEVETRENCAACFDPIAFSLELLGFDQSLRTLLEHPLSVALRFFVRSIDRIRAHVVDWRCVELSFTVEVCGDVESGDRRGPCRKLLRVPNLRNDDLVGR